MSINMDHVLITGGSGFLGGLLKRKLLGLGVRCVNVDLVKDLDFDKNLISVQGDIRNQGLLQQVCCKYKVKIIYHCAAILAHSNHSRSFLWSSNVDGTHNVATCAEECGVRQVVYISSNCLWAKNFNRPVKEEDRPEPVEIYGASKWEGEKILLKKVDRFDVAIFRSPTIIDEGRLGLLSILFEFVDEGRKVWVVRGGKNVYQFIYAQDLIDACLLVSKLKCKGVFNVGSDGVRPLRDVYEYVIGRAGTGARVRSLPAGVVLPTMKVMHHIGLSPLGPYHYRMINEDFVFNTKKIKSELGWQPTLTNEQMLWKAYRYYHNNKEDIYNNQGRSDHMSLARMGVIKVLKWMS